jgi:hypothetical protein
MAHDPDHRSAPSRSSSPLFAAGLVCGCALALIGAHLLGIIDLPQEYHRFFDWIGDGTGMVDSLLHVHAGMAVLLLARIVTRRSLATPVPLLVVCLAELMNEVMDRLAFGSWRIADTLSDVVNTLFWPSVLMLGLRLRPADYREDRSALTS